MKLTKTTSDTPDYDKVKVKSKKKKTHDLTMIGEEKPKKLTVIDEYQELMTWKRVPVHEGVIERIATEMIHWAKEDNNALRLSAFFLKKNIPRTYLYKWRDEFPVFKLAFHEAMQAIGSRREEGAIKKVYDAGMIKFMQPLYDEEWKKTEEWRATLSKEHERQGNIKVVIEQFPSSDLVPEKKDE